jgi:hypothetical protein
MIHNLSSDESYYGKFGTPDKDLIDTVLASGRGKHAWVRLLGTKMKVLILQLDNIKELSPVHKARIRELDKGFRKEFPPRPTQENTPYEVIQ